MIARCQSCERLRERVRELERELHTDWLPPMEWKLSPKQMKLFMLLSRGVMVDRPTIMGALYDEETEEPGWKIIDAFIFQLRRKLPQSIAIENRYGMGYQLTPAAAAIVRQMRG